MNEQNELDKIKMEQAKIEASLEAELEGEQGTQQTVQVVKEQVQQLQSQFKDAEEASNRAKSQLEELRVLEAKATAELEVMHALKQRIDSEIERLTQPVEQLQHEVEQVKETLSLAQEQLKEIVSQKDEEIIKTEQAKRGLWAAIAMQTRIKAEIESLQREATDAQEKTSKIEEQITDLQSQLETEKKNAEKTQQELQAVRMLDAKTKAELVVAQEEREKSESIMAEINVPLDKLHTQDALTDTFEKVESQEPFPEEADDTEIAGVLTLTDANLQTPQSSSDTQNDVQTERQTEGHKQDNEPSLVNEKLGAIYELADAGLSVNEISKNVNIPQGKVAFILQLRQFKPDKQKGV